jgi:hypothetical protein
MRSLFVTLPACRPSLDGSKDAILKAWLLLILRCTVPDPAHALALASPYMQYALFSKVSCSGALLSVFARALRYCDSIDRS